MHNLIEEVLVQILVRLPTKCILRFKIVSKSWHHLINSTSFIRQHLHFINTHPSIANLIYNHGSKNVFCAGSMHTWLLCKANKQIRQLDWGVLTRIVVNPYNYWFSLIRNPVNGIYCLKLMPTRNTTKNLFSMCVLWNPAIRQIHIVPVIPDVEEIGNVRICGFGFDSSTNDYKIIVITKYDNGRGCWFHIYSHATNRWRQLDPFKVCVKCPTIIDATSHDKCVSFTATVSQWDGFYFNGACHWHNAFCNHHGWKDKRILSFNFKDEIFRGYKVPEVICCEELLLVTQVKGCLGVVCSVNEPKLEFQVWIMREYGVDSSWFKAYSIPTKVSDFFTGIDDDEFYVKEDSGQLVSYRLNAPEDISVYEYCRLPYSFHILPYRESLVPVKPRFI